MLPVGFVALARSLSASHLVVLHRTIHVAVAIAIAVKAASGMGWLLVHLGRHEG